MVIPDCRTISYAEAQECRLPWGEAPQTSFEVLKKALSKTSVLQIPDFSSKSTFVCDASYVTISAVLHQMKGERNRHLSPTVAVCYLLQRRDVRFMRRSVLLWCMVVRKIILTMNTRNFAPLPLTKPWLKN
jgi:hypothetical protein